jgi:hypothetical protein
VRTQLGVQVQGLVCSNTGFLTHKGMVNLVHVFLYFETPNTTQLLAFQFLQLTFVCLPYGQHLPFVFDLLPKVILTFMHLLVHFEASLFLTQNVFS